MLEIDPVYIWCIAAAIFLLAMLIAGVLTIVLMLSQQRKGRTIAGWKLAVAFLVRVVFSFVILVLMAIVFVICLFVVGHAGGGSGFNPRAQHW